MAVTTSLRFVQLAAAACLCGQPVFLAFVWRPAARNEPAHRLTECLRRHMRTLSLLSAAVVASAAIAELAVAPGGATTSAGRQLVWRAMLACFIVAARPWHAPTGLRVAAWGVAGAALLGTFSLTGHAAAIVRQSWVPFVANLVHVSATAIWYGGLVCLLLLPWENLTGGIATALAQTVHRFARLGLLTMAALAGSGVLLASRYLYGLEALSEHRYGGTLLVKLAFVGGVLALAGVNHMWLRPRLSESQPAPPRRLSRTTATQRSPARWLRRFIAGEIVLGFAVLLIAVRLAATAPATTAPVRLTVTLPGAATDIVTLAVPPLQPVRLTVRNPHAAPGGIYVPQIPGSGDERGRAGDLQVMVDPGAVRSVTFQAPAAGQYVIYYVSQDGLRPAGWILIRPQ